LLCSKGLYGGAAISNKAKRGLSKEVAIEPQAYIAKRE